MSGPHGRPRSKLRRARLLMFSRAATLWREAPPARARVQDRTHPQAQGLARKRLLQQIDLARLAARGERITVAALPWVAPVYRAMPQVAEGAPQVEVPIWASVSLISSALSGFGET